jgi:hypothetical protein
MSATYIAGKVNVEADLFASRVNFQLAQYVAWRPDPGCIAVDAFTLTWDTKMFSFHRLV